MNVIVILNEPTEFVVGCTSDRVTFVDTKYTLDEGDLHVYRDGDGNAASFPRGSWRAVVRGDVAVQSGRTEVTR